MYGPTVCDYQALLDWVQARGLTVDSTYSDRSVVDATASAATIEAVFNVTLHDSTRPDGSQFYAPDRDPSFDLDVLLSGILGFDNCEVPQAI
jgi:subtilase family serine protease